MRKPTTNKPIVVLSIKEEVGNAITHGLMALFLLLFLPYSAILAYQKDGMLFAVGISIFMISLFLMFLTSTLYHSMHPDTKHKKVFQILDHIFIYFAIAGSYTPVALSLIGGWTGIIILIIQWTMVFIGILYKSLSRRSIPKLSLMIYLVMGWIAVLFLPALVSRASLTFLILLGLGGLLYTIGAMFYIQKHRPYFHFIWHLFINLAATTHFIALLFFI